jgi:hypothetical protein
MRSRPPSMMLMLMLQAALQASAMFGVCMGTASADDDAGSVTRLMLSTSDLEPLADMASIRQSELVVVSALGRVPLAIDSVDTSLRSSVPSSTRSRSLIRSDEVFANSAAVVPLLVGDLEPPASPVSRPLAGGRLVGARPSLPISRTPLTRPLAQRSVRQSAR